MKLVILYHPQSDHSHVVEAFARDFSKQKGHTIELVSLESRDGSTMAALYDIVRYPALLVIGKDNALVKNWQGPVMPLMDEVSFYALD